MLHRKIYQLCEAKSDVWVYLRDQGRWLERARILDIEGDVVTLRYETEDEDEVSSWEEMVRLESIGAVTSKLASVPKGIFLLVSFWYLMIVLRLNKSDLETITALIRVF
jgi:hypothetical protein